MVKNRTFRGFSPKTGGNACGPCALRSCMYSRRLLRRKKAGGGWGQTPFAEKKAPGTSNFSIFMCFMCFMCYVDKGRSMVYYSSIR
jgi:hypothetical protein